MDTRFKKWFILFNAALSTFMATLDGSIVNIALPIISKELKVNISSIQWIVTSYLLTISILLLVWGRLSDIYGRKKIFAFGFMVFTIGSALCGFSSSLHLLVFARILQAVGASAMMGLSQGIVTQAFPPNERGKALGIIGTTVAIGSLVGPSLGGVLVHTIGWQSIFFINIPIGLLGTLLTFAIIPDIHDKSASKAFDFKGTFLFALTILLIYIGLLFVQEGKLTILQFLPMLAIAIISFYLLLRVEKKSSSPLINLNLFKIHEFSLGLGSGFLSFVAINSTLLFFPFYLQNVLKMDTLAAGLLISFYPITAAVTAPFSGWLSDKITYRPLTIVGLTISTVVLIGISTLNANSSHILIGVLMAFMGAGLSFFQSPNNSSVMGSVPKNQLGIAGGLNALIRNLGMVSGATLSVILFSFMTRANLNSLSGGAASISTELFLKGFRVVILMAAAACFISLLISLSRAAFVKPTVHKS